MVFNKTVLTGVVAAPYVVIDGKVFLVDGNGRHFETPSENDADWLCSVLNEHLDVKGVFELIPFPLYQTPSQFMRDRDGSRLYFIQGDGKVFTTTSKESARWLAGKLNTSGDHRSK